VFDVNNLSSSISGEDREVPMQAGDFRGMSHAPDDGRPIGKQQVGIGEGPRWEAWRYGVADQTMV
jgi:hypothetical protein